MAQITAPQIRQSLDNWLAPGATLPTPEAVHLLKLAWEQLKPCLIAEYHPVIDDRLALVESILSRQPEPPTAA
jgi:hypothetical protein